MGANLSLQKIRASIIKQFRRSATIMKQVRSIIGMLGLLLLSFGLDWTSHFLRSVWISWTFEMYSQLIFKVVANLLIMFVALGYGLKLAKDPYPRLLALVMVVTGFSVWILHVSLRILSYIGFPLTYLNLSGALLLLVGLMSFFKSKSVR